MSQVEVVTESLEGASGQHTPEAAVSRPLDGLFEPMFDELVRIMDGEGGYPSVRGRDPETKNPLFEYLDRETLAQQKLEDVRLYVRNAVIEHGLGIDPTELRADAPVTVTVLVERYIELGLEKARAKALSKGKVATHVTVSPIDDIPEETSRFKEIISRLPGLAKSALAAFDPGANYHSGEIPLSKTKVIPIEELEHYVRPSK